MAVIFPILMNVLKTTKGYNISEILLILSLVTLPLGGYAINSSAVILFFLSTIINYFNNKPTLKFEKLTVLFLIFFGFFLLSLFWTDNLENTKTGLVRFLSYLVLPLSFAFSSNINFDKNKIIELFSKSILFYATYCILLGVKNAIINIDISYLFYHNLSSNLRNLNAIYLSVFVSFGICFYLVKKEKSKFEVFSLIFLSLFLILLSSKLIISITAFIFIFYNLKNELYKKINLKYFLIIFGVSILFIFASSNLSSRLKVEYEKTKIDEVLKTKDFGSVYLWTGIGLRIFQTKAFFEILQEQKKIFFGFGLNNAQNSLNKKYEEYNLYPGFLNYNYHNQYIQIFAELGFVGLILFLMILFIILKEAINRKDYFLFSFIIITLAVCITETFLWRQRGMVFFIIISLLLSRSKKLST